MKGRTNACAIQTAELTTGAENPVGYCELATDLDLLSFSIVVIPCTEINRIFQRFGTVCPIGI
jgi:hypothetical protein